MRNTRVDGYEDVPRAVLATGNEYPDGVRLPSHSHLRGQCLYASTGVLTVTTCEGSWIVPPRRASWVPGGVAHTVHMDGATITRSAYIRTQTAVAAGLPAHCAVIGVSRSCTSCCAPRWTCRLSTRSVRATIT